MALSYYLDKYLQPASENVYEVLGAAAQYWKDMEEYIADQGPITEEWRIYTKKAGWCKKLLLKQNSEERSILFEVKSENNFGVLKKIIDIKINH